MKSKVMPLAVVVAGVSVAAFAAKGPAPVTLDPDAVRTYCLTDPLLRVTSATESDPLSSNPVPPGYPVFTNDHSIGDPPAPPSLGGLPGNTLGNEVVWRVIGTFPQTPPGEGYCGYLQVPPTRIGARNVANGIQDCLGVARFQISSSGYKSAALHWDGSAGANITGTRLSIAVSLCDPGPDRASFRDDEDGDNLGSPNRPVADADKDCIIDGLDFGGGSFRSINDVELRKSDNNVGVVGGVSDINFFEVGPVRHIPLNQAALDAINKAGAEGGSVVFLLRCADSSGHTNGFVGGNTNALVIHDPPGIGGLGAASLQLELD